MNKRLFLQISLMLWMFSSNSQSLSIRLEHKANFQYTSIAPTLFYSRGYQEVATGLPNKYYTFSKINTRPYTETSKKIGISIDWKINQLFNLESSFYLYEDISFGYVGNYYVGDAIDSSSGIIIPILIGNYYYQCFHTTKIPVILSYNILKPRSEKLSLGIALSLGTQFLINITNDSLYSQMKMTSTGSSFAYNVIETVTTTQYGGPLSMNLIMGGVLRLNIKKREVASLKLYYEMGFRPFTYTAFNLVIDNRSFNHEIYNYGSSLNFVLSVPIRIAKFKRYVVKV